MLPTKKRISWVLENGSGDFMASLSTREDARALIRNERRHGNHGKLRIRRVEHGLIRLGESNVGVPHVADTVDDIVQEELYAAKRKLGRLLEKRIEKKLRALSKTSGTKIGRMRKMIAECAQSDGLELDIEMFGTTFCFDQRRGYDDQAEE